LKTAEFVNQWEDEENYAFEGWDFSHIDGRWDCPEPPWNYQAVVKAYLKDTDTLLDMGTGGGENLLTIGHPYDNTFVTEAYPPNFELCQKTLSPLGITVTRTFSDDKLPFPDECFDFVINRHESFDLEEVNRVLKKGGFFITQQVGNQNSVDLVQRFIEGFNPHNPAHVVDNYTGILKSMGFQIIDTDESVYTVNFFDIGAFVFYAKACVWEFPGFTVKKHAEKLLECQREVETNGFISCIGHRFIIASQKTEE